MDVLGYAKENPVKASAIVFVGGLVFLYVWRAQTGSSQSTVAYDPNSDPAVINAEIAATSQLAQINAQADAATRQINGQIQLQQDQGAITLAIAKLQAQTQGDLNLGSLTLGLAQNASSERVSTLGITTTADVQKAGLQAQTDLAQLTTRASIDINQANNLTTQHVTDSVNEVQKILSGNQTQVAIAQTNAAVEISKSHDNAGIFGGLFSAIGSLF